MLTRQDIGEIKKNNMPNEILKFTLEMVAILMDERT